MFRVRSSTTCFVRFRPRNRLRTRAQTRTRIRTFYLQQHPPPRVTLPVNLPPVTDLPPPPPLPLSRPHLFCPPFSAPAHIVTPGQLLPIADHPPPFSPLTFPILLCPFLPRRTSARFQISHHPIFHIPFQIPDFRFLISDFVLPTSSCTAFSRCPFPTSASCSFERRAFRWPPPACSCACECCNHVHDVHIRTYESVVMTQSWLDSQCEARELEDVGQTGRT